MQPFYIEGFSAFPINIFTPNVFNKRNLPDMQDKCLFLAFNHSLSWSFFKKFGYVIKQNCEQKEKLEFNVK